MSESAISAKSAKQIFANFVKFVKSIFGTTRRSEGSVMEAEYPTNYQRISNLLLTIRPFRVAILAVLLVFVGGWNSEVFAAWSGSGEAVKKVGSTYYVVYDTDEYELSKGKTNDHALSGPGAGLTFEAKRNRAGTGDLLVTQNSGTSKLYEGNPGRVTGYSWGVELVDFQNYGSYGVDVNTTKITFKNDASISTNTQKQIKNVKVTMAQYIENPSATSLNFGEADINSTTSEEKVTVAWCNVPAMSYQITDDANGLFSVSVANNSEAGKYNTATFTVYYKHTKAGAHTAKLKITDTFNGYSKVISLSGTTNKQQPTITWSPDEAYFNVDDVLSATSAPGTTVTLSGNSTYVGCEGNKATMLAATTGEITITAHVAGNDIYADKDFTKEITITNLEKQYISWDQEFSRLKTTDGTKSITLNATSDSGLPVTYELVGDKTGLSLTQSGSVWTLTYSATECKNTTIVAKQGGNATYAPASSVSKVVKVIDPTKVCDTNETLVNSTVTLKEQSATYNIDIPSTMTIQVSRTKTGFFDIYINGFKVEIYSGRNGTGEKLHDPSYSAGDINNSKTISLSNLNIAAKSVKLISDASNGYNVNSVTYTKRKYCDLSKSSLSFETYPNTVTMPQTVDVSYANYPITVECSNPKFAFSPAEFGDCDAYGTQTISVTYTAGADEGGDLGYLYIKDNTGTTLKTCTLNVNISKVSQSITSHTIETAYKTTDRVELSAVANSKLTEFVYSASPEGVASFDGNVMTFVKAGTIAITATQPGSNIYAATSATVNNVVVSKVTPVIVNNPTAKAIEYRSKLENSTWTAAGAADVTLRGVEHTTVDGEFSWNDPDHVVMDAAGEHNYKATFKPTNGGMYNNVEYDQTVQILRTTQTIEMNDGAVKVAVDGIDAGAADSKIDLDNLIASQTSDIVSSVQRAGAVTYEVISANKANATIGEGNVFSATAIGDYTIRATKAETDYYNEVTDEFVVSVSKRANTMTISNTTFERFVEEEVTNVRDAQNSDAEVQTSSDFPTIAYYDVANNKIVIPNSESDEQMFGAYKTVTIKIWQEATDRFEACEKTITLGVKKYVTTSNGEDYIIKVNETKTANYGFTNTSASYPSNNLTDDFYYTIDEPNFENAALNNGTELITYDPATNEITGHNAGTTKITFFQKETYKYTGATLMCNISVEKRENQIANSWSNTWQKAMSENGTANISFSSTHGDYANYPISIEQIYGEDVATLTGDASGASITTNTTKGYAIWHLYQEENYEYGSAEADVMVMVGVPAPPTCYVYQDNSEHEFATGIGDAEGHFESPIAINSPVDKIWFNAKRQLAGVNNFVVQYSKDNGKNWSTLLSPSLDTKYKSSAFSATFPTMQGTERITHVRFGAKTGATLSKWYKDVQISRKAYLNIQDAEKKKISKLPTMMCTIDETSSAEAKFYIDYSTCADEILIESSNPEHFTVSRSNIDVSDKHDNLTSAKEEITVTYHSTDLGTHNAVITVRTSYQTCALSVSGETTKRTPTLTWQEGYTNNPLTLPIGLTVNAIKPAATTTSTALIKYESNDESVVRILDNGYAFQVVGLGSAILTAIVPENEKWKSVSDTRVIQATEKVVQEIVWNQSFPRFMEPGNVIDLDAKVYLRNLSTGELTYSEERSQYISYSCPLNNGIVSVSGNQMTILNYGEVKVTASVSGNADYEAAAPVIVLINVRQPSAGCATPFVLNKEDVIDMYEVDVDFSDYTHLTTEEMISDEIDLDPTQGKPNKLSFRYYGEEYKLGLIKSFGGFVKFEQRVNSQWLPVENSRVETVKNEWKTNSDLQLDERADALRIIRESGATGHHKIKDIQVTRKQYLRATQNEINLGEVTLGQATPVIVGFDYSDVKGDLTAHTINSTTDVTIKDNGIIDLQCGGFGHYNLQVTFTPTQLGEWQGAIEVYDNIANLSITVQLSATVNANEEYIFNKEGNWNTNTNWTTNLVPDENVDITVAKNMTISSAANVHSIAIEKDVTVTVKSGATLVIGNGTPKSLESYGNLHVENGGNVILNDGASLILNDVILDAQLGITNEQTTSASCSGQITNESQLVVNGDAYFQLTLDPSGRNTLGWYDFVVPFPVDVIGGISIKGDEETPMQFNVNYAVMDYSEAKRAVNGKCWNKFCGTMEPGKVYTITLDEENPKWNTVIFKKKAGADVTGDRSFTTEYSGLGTDAKDNGWNGFGNGTLHHTELNVPEGTLIQMYDHTNRCYQPREAKDFTIPVGLSFFMQFDGVETINLEPAEGNSQFRAPSREPRQVSKFRLSLKEEGAENAADKLWVSANEEATGEYVIGQDVLKMGTINESKVARLWSVRNNITLCSNDMPMTDNTAEGVLGLYAPKSGYYTIEVENGPEDAALYLTHNGEIIWDLTASPYVLDLAKGTNNGYGLRIEARAPQIATGVDNTEANAKTVRKVLMNDKIYVITPEGAMYDVLGKGVKF